jgi:hypothetical protein
VTSNFPHQNHGTVVWDSCTTLSGVCLGGCHPLWRTFSGHFSLTSEEAAGPLTLHLPYVSIWDSVWTFPVSLAATRGIPCLVSFPPPTKMLPLGGFPLRKGALLGSPIQVSPVLRLHAPTRGGIAACRALHQLSSRAILQTAWHVWALVVSVWRLVKLTFLLCRRLLAYAWCHVSVFVCSFTLHPHLVRTGVASF